VTFDGQLKRRDLDLKPYEILTLAPAEMTIQAWRRLRTLEDTSALENDAVAQKYSRDAIAAANRHFSGLIPLRSEKDDLYTHAFRAVYARIAVLFFCPPSVNDVLYANAILGHYSADTERKQRDLAATAHYFDYRIGDGQGQINGHQGIRLGTPGVEILEVFQPKKGTQKSMTTETADEQQVLTTKAHKTRGTLTTTPGTFDRVKTLMEQRGMIKHDEIVADLLANDATAHQMYGLLAPLAERLHTDGPIATLQALISAASTGGSAAGPLAELLTEIQEEEDPASYLRGLVERDRKFQAGIAQRYKDVDFTAMTFEQLKAGGIKDIRAANERYRRAVDAIIAWNNAQTDPLHLWYINAAAVRDLVGGKNELVQRYLDTRAEELEAHHKQYGLTPKQNRKPVKIEAQITVQ
jgi:hypothetical protein